MGSLTTSLTPTLRTSGDDPSHTALLEALEEALRRGNIDSALGLVAAIRRTLDQPRQRKQSPGHATLTDREWSTLVLLTDATLSQKDVARSLEISLNTVKTHIRSLYQKLGAHSRAEAIELGLLA